MKKQYNEKNTIHDEIDANVEEQELFKKTCDYAERLICENWIYYFLKARDPDSPKICYLGYNSDEFSEEVMKTVKKRLAQVGLKMTFVPNHDVSGEITLSW